LPVYASSVLGGRGGARTRKVQGKKKSQGNHKDRKEGLQIKSITESPSLSPTGQKGSRKKRPGRALTEGERQGKKKKRKFWGGLKRGIYTVAGKRASQVCPGVWRG